MKTRTSGQFARQAGLSLVELLVSMALGVMVMSSVVSVLLVSKSNFISERELAALQENARFAVRYMSESIRMAGFSGCGGGQPLLVANAIPGASANRFIDAPGLEGFDHGQPAGAFPAEFQADVAARTDAILVKRAESSGLTVDSHTTGATTIGFNRTHDIKPGQVMLVADTDCQQIGIFMVTNPPNIDNDATILLHEGGVGGNCRTELKGNYTCDSPAGVQADGYRAGSSVMRLRSEAFYVGASASGNGVPALFREYLEPNAITTQAEELVQGVENLQIQYGLDNALGDGLADIYLDAGDPAMNWGRVVSVRLLLRMRSINPVYNMDIAYGTFRGIAGTDGSDRFMRHLVSTTVQLRN